MPSHWDLSWEERHARIMRCIVHECSVPQCTGSQPLMWVNTLTEAIADEIRRSRSGGRAINWSPARSPLRYFLSSHPGSRVESDLCRRMRREHPREQQVHWAFEWRPDS